MAADGFDNKSNVGINAVGQVAGNTRFFGFIKKLIWSNYLETTQIKFIC